MTCAGGMEEFGRLAQSVSQRLNCRVMSAGNTLDQKKDFAIGAVLSQNEAAKFVALQIGLRDMRRQPSIAQAFLQCHQRCCYAADLPGTRQLAAGGVQCLLCGRNDDLGFLLEIVIAEFTLIAAQRVVWMGDGDVFQD